MANISMALFTTRSAVKLEFSMIVSPDAEALEANLVERKKFGPADGASIDLQGTTVNLRVSREDEEIVGDASQSSYGYDHIGLEVEDIETAFKDLQARGFSFLVPPTDISNLKIAFFKGPEEITIELLQPL